MHVSYKFGLLLIFILSVSICYIHAAAAPAPASASASSLQNLTTVDYDDINNNNNDDDYDYDYYDDDDDDDGTNSTHVKKIANNNNETTTATSTLYRLPNFVDLTSTTNTKPFLVNSLEVPKRSNHVLEPNCPKSCLCLEDYKHIQCSNARLTHVPDDIPNTALIIDLSQNRINELHADDFANYTKVREINLYGNQLTRLDKEIFDGLTRLSRLNLANNHLTSIDPDTFNGVADLSKLDLSNNTIKLPKETSFLNQPNLIELSCRNCSWTELYDETFSNLSSLTVLRLDRNDFNKKINTKAFTPLRNLIKLKLPELDETNIQELCNLLKSIDNISFKHFDISCYELVLGASFNESLILPKEPTINGVNAGESGGGDGLPAVNRGSKKPQPVAETDNNRKTNKNAVGVNQHLNMASDTSNLTLPTVIDFDDSIAAKDVSNNHTILNAGILATGMPITHTNGSITHDGNESTYQVPVSQETINIMLISIMIIAIIGIIVGIICRKDVGGIKTKCCRTRKQEPKDQVHPTEEIPLNKLA